MRVGLTLEMPQSPHREQSWADLWEDYLWTFEQAEETGLSDLVLCGPHPGINLRGEGRDSLERFAEEVLPVRHGW